MPKAKPISCTLMDLEWARVYADRIKDELKLIAKMLSDLNAHAMNPHLVKSAVLLKKQMKEASQQVGAMRQIASQYESRWMDTIRTALAQKYPDLTERLNDQGRPAAMNGSSNGSTTVAKTKSRSARNSRTSGRVSRGAAAGNLEQRNGGGD